MVIVIGVFIDIVGFTTTDTAMFIDTDICPLARTSEFVPDDSTSLGERANFSS